MTQASLVDRFTESGAAHINSRTGCLLWDGEVSRKGDPRLNGNSVREMIWQLAGGNLRQGQAVEPACENQRCVLPEHQELSDRSAAIGVEYTEEELSQVLALDREGFRIETIAQRLGMSRTRAARIRKIAKEPKTDG